MRYFIYFLYNADGRVDAYVPHFLNAIRDRYDVIHVVFNGTLAEGEKDRLNMADRVQERPNDEFDVGAYKAAIFSNPDSFYAEECDEVTLANFTFFAPIGSMDPYFDWVAQNRAEMDFWGLSAHKKMVPNPFTGTGELPYHIQSHWITVGKAALQSGAFIDYWRNLARIESYMDSVLKHESQFTKHFSDLGYRYKLFFDDAPFKSDYPAFNNIDKALKAGLPILKRRLFYHTPTLYFDNYDVNLRRALEDCRDRDLFDEDMIWDSVKTTDPGTLYQTTDGLRIVPDGSLVPPDQTATEASKAIIILQGEPRAEDIRAIFSRINAPLDLMMIGPAALTEDVSAMAAANTSLASCSFVPVDSLKGGFEWLKQQAADFGDEAPVLFAMVAPDELDQFDYGMRHLAGDATVARFARDEIERSGHFGLGMPAARTFGSPAELDEVSDQLRNELRNDLAGMPFDTGFKSFFLYSTAEVFWIRPALLKRLAEVVLSHAVEDVALFADLDGGNGAGAVIDSKKIDSLLVAGLPFLANAEGFITRVISNTRELPRNFVKAEQRLRLVSERLGIKNPFALDHQLEYLSQYLSEEDRSSIFGQVHTAAFKAGWDKASRDIWEQAFQAGREKERELLSEDPGSQLSIPSHIRDELFNAGYQEGWEKASKESQEASYKKGYEEAWKSASEKAHKTSFDDGYKKGWAKAQEARVETSEAALEARYKSGFEDGWKQSSDAKDKKLEELTQEAWKSGWDAAQQKIAETEKDRFDEVFKTGYGEGWEAARANATDGEKERFDTVFKQGYEQGWEAAVKKSGGESKRRGLFNQNSDK